MIRDNTGLIFKQLKKFGLLNDPEAESLGYEALYSAVLTFNKDKNIRFSTYATVCIYNALGGYVRQLNKVKQLDVVSYNNTAYHDDDESHEFIEFICIESDVAEGMLKEERHTDIMDRFYTVLNSLENERHKEIVMAWKNSDYKATTVQIASEVGVSQPYVSQVLSSFKSCLKKELIKGGYK